MSGALALGLAASPACAPKPLELPTGTGAPYADFAEPLSSATSTCREVRALTAELGLSGRVGRAKLRGRAIVGLEAPDRIRLEALAPFGPPVFILAARDGRATLLLPRDDRVLRDASPDEIVEALAGVRIDPGSLRTAFAGCALDATAPASARSFGDRWLAIDVGGGGTIFLERIERAWRVRGARTPAFAITYDELAAARPARITIRAEGTMPAEVRLRLSQVEMNPSLDPKAFEVAVPASAAPLTLEELRDAGPLGEKNRSSVWLPRINPISGTTAERDAIVSRKRE